MSKKEVAVSEAGFYPANQNNFLELSKSSDWLKKVGLPNEPLGFGMQTGKSCVEQ